MNKKKDKEEDKMEGVTEETQKMRTKKTNSKTESHNRIYVWRRMDMHYLAGGAPSKLCPILEN